MLAPNDILYTLEPWSPLAKVHRFSKIESTLGTWPHSEESSSGVVHVLYIDENGESRPYLVSQRGDAVTHVL